MKTLIAILIILLSTPVWSADRWLREGGAGLKDGTSYANAWGNISDIVSSELAAGGTLYIDGSHYAGYLASWTQSGTAGSPITITAYDSTNPPILDGRQELTGWTETGTAELWYYSLSFSPHIIAQEKDGVMTVLEDERETGGTCDFGWAAGRNWCYDDEDDRIYYRAVDGTFDTEKVYWFRREPFNFANGVSYITISNLKVRNYLKAFEFRVGPSGDTALSEITLSNVNIERCRLGLEVLVDNSYGATTISVTDSLFDYVGAGILLTPAGVGAEQISGVTISNNTFSNAGNCNTTAQALGTITDEWGMATRGTYYDTGYTDMEQLTLANASTVTVDSNTFGPGDGRGILLDCQNGMDVKAVTISNNVFTGLTYTGIMALGNSGALGDEYEGITFKTNRFVNNGNGGNEGWYSSELQWGALILAPTTPFSAANYVYNNTFEGNYRGVRINADSDHLVIKNNIFSDTGTVVTKYHIAVAGAPTSVSIDYNLYYPSSGCVAAECWYLTDAYVAFATWDNTYDGNAPTPADPGFTGGDDYFITDSSPAYNAGTDLSGTSCKGAEDIGYYEVCNTVSGMSIN